MNFNASVSSMTPVATVNFLSEMPTLTLTANSTVDYAKTSISSTVSPLQANGTSTATLIVQLKDTYFNAIGVSGQNIVVTTNLGTLVGSMVYHPATGTYRQVLIAPTSVGSGSLTATLQTINGTPVAGVTYNLPLQAAAISAQNSSIDISERIFVGNSTQKLITISLKDANNNGITAPATIGMTKVFQPGGLAGAFGNSNNVTSVGNGVYQITLTSPSNTTTACGTGVTCTEDISANVSVVGSPNIVLGPLRVQYKSAALAPSAAHSYLVMDNTSIAASVGSALTGRIYLRAAHATSPESIAVGGNKNSIALEFSGCTPPDYSITDNNSGNYTVALNSPASGCSGSMTVKYGGVIIGTTLAPGNANASPVSYTFFGQVSLGQSVLTLNPAIVSGGGSTTVSLEIKDAGGSNFPNCIIPTSYFQFVENHASTALTGSVTCSVVGGKAIYSQSLQRGSDLDEFHNIPVSAQYNTGSGWNSFSSMKTLQVTPPNLAGFTIDCDNESVYHDKNIYVNGGVLTINGWEDGTIPTRGNCSPSAPIRFKNLKIGPTGVVTHSAATTTKSFGVEFEATENVTIDAGGSIDAAGKGYLGGVTMNESGRGPGNVASVTGPGSYGGVGVSNYYGPTNDVAKRQAVYGISNDPNYPGSGGYRFSTGVVNATGGGLVRIKAPAIILNGSINASGVQNSSFGVGSGGGVKLNLGGAGALTGSGSIVVRGGFQVDGNAGRNAYGGGGRIAIIGDASAFTGTLDALSGLGVSQVATNSYGYELSHGTIYITKAPTYLRNPTEAASKMNFPWTNVDLGGLNQSFIGGLNSVSLIIPLNSPVSIKQEINFASIENNGVLTIDHASVEIAGDLINNGTLTINRIKQDVGTATETMDSLTNNGTLTLLTKVKAENAIVAGTLNLKENLYGETLEIKGLVNVFLNGIITGDDIVLSNGATLSHEAVTASTEGIKVEVNASNSLIVANGATLNVKEKGYPGTTVANGGGGALANSFGYGPGFSVYATGYSSWSRACNNDTQGGNHYTKGGSTNTTWNNNSTWGNLASPISHGGGACGTRGGGGVIRLIAKTLNLNASLMADGGRVSAGGSIFLDTETVNFGSGVVLRADGGTSFDTGAGRPSGAGGIVTVRRKYKTGSYTGSVEGGTNISGVKTAQDGALNEFIVP